jgi:hypothetical protein
MNDGWRKETRDLLSRGSSSTRLFPIQTGSITRWNQISHDRDRENGKSREGKRLEDKHLSRLTYLVDDWIAVKEKAEELATWYGLVEIDIPRSRSSPVISGGSECKYNTLVSQRRSVTQLPQEEEKGTRDRKGGTRGKVKGNEEEAQKERRKEKENMSGVARKGWV